MDEWEIAARLGVEDTMGRYVRFADSGRSDGLAALFVDDGVLATDTEQIQGRAAIARYLEATKASLAGSPGTGRIRHHVSSARVDFPSRSEARATSYFLAMAATGPDHWGLYRDRMVQVDDRWLFAHRAALVEGWAPASWAARRLGHAARRPEDR